MKPASRLSAIAFAVFACASTAALAENGTGFYVGGGVGYAGHNTNCEGVDDCSKSHTGAKLLAGYQIIPNLAIESSYGDTGRTKATFNQNYLSSKSTSFTVAALGIYPVNKEIELFGKLGFHNTRNKVDINLPGLVLSGSITNSGLLAGVGAQYRFTPSLLSRIEYEHLSRAVYDLDGRKDINLVTASLIYQF